VTNIARALSCLAVVLLAGVAHGLYSHRWEPAAEMGDVQGRLDSLPHKIGSWKATDSPLEADMLDRASIRAYISRDYHDKNTGRSIRILVVAGPPGPIAVHTPDVCYQGAGYELSGEPEAVTIGADANTNKGRLWRGKFDKTQSPVPSALLIAWGWNGGDGWEAADHRTTRVRYAFRPVLYKLYLVTDSLPADKNPLPADKKGQADPLAEFAGQLLPELDRALAAK
jgi:hypothetical protein